MGACSPALKLPIYQIKTENESITYQIENYNNEINTLESSLNNKKREIMQKINIIKDYKIERDLEIYYDELKEKNEKTTKLESLKKIKYELDNLSNIIKEKTSFDELERSSINQIFEKLSDDRKSLESQIVNPGDLYSKNDIIKLYQLKDKVVSEIRNIYKKKPDFINRFNKKNLSKIYLS